MKGDFSRISHDRRKHYSRVLKQQGRVELDADHNEGQEIHHHLDRVTRRDVIGASGVPKKNGAFKLTPTPDKTDLFISEGRFYLDGLVIEVDGTPLPIRAVQGKPKAVRIDRWVVDGQAFATGQWVRLTGDGLLSTQAQVTAIDADSMTLELSADPGAFLASGASGHVQRIPTLRTQADAPDANAALVAGEPRLVYLEAFESLVTHLEEPRLREVALGGPDTATRVRTVWRLLTTDAGLADDCQSAIPNWPPAPSKARLTAYAAGTVKSDDPCVLPPEGGYRGLENRLYRVEIHSPGGKDANGNALKPTYKWSRDNGAVAFAIEAFVPAEGGTSVKTLKLASMGRDRTLSLREGDWVEVTDHMDEATGSSGILARVEKVDLAERTVRLDKDVATYKGRAPAPKLRRWDMKENVTDRGVEIDFSEDELEDGVKVKFSGSAFRAGDWWAFAARVATASVEELHARLPFNEPRRYARIGLLTWEMDADKVTKTPHILDCRKPFDPLTEPCGCCCDVTVGDGVESFGDFTDIQKALDHVDHKGRVCILKGKHKLKKTVTVKGGPLHIRSCGFDAVIEAPGNMPAFFVQNAKKVTLENLHVVARTKSPAVVVASSTDVRFVRCDVESRGPADVRDVAVAMVDATRVEVESCSFAGVPALALQGKELRAVRSLLSGGVAVLGGSEGIRLEENDVVGGAGDGVTLGWSHPDLKVPLLPRMRDVTVVRNRIRNAARNGIATREPTESDPGVRVMDLVIAENEVVECLQSPPAPTGKGGQVHGGIVLRGLTRATVHANHVARNGDRKARAVGILAEGAGVTITDNLVEDNGGAPEEGVTRGYSVSFEDGKQPASQQGHSRVVNDVTFKVLDANGNPVPSTHIHRYDNEHGLFTHAIMDISFPEPTEDVRLKVFLSSPGKLTVFSATDKEVQEIGSDRTKKAQEVRFSLKDVERARIETKGESILCKLETMGVTLPQPLQGGIFALSQGAIYHPGKDEKSEQGKNAMMKEYAGGDVQAKDMQKDGSRDTSGKDGSANEAVMAHPATAGSSSKSLEKESKKLGGARWDVGDDLAVHDNVVGTPRGPALVVVARGPASLQDNRLRTDAAAVHGEFTLDRAACLLVDAGETVLYQPIVLMKPGEHSYNMAYGGAPPPPDSDQPQDTGAAAAAPATTGPTMDAPGYFTHQSFDRGVLVRGNQASFVDTRAKRSFPLAALRSDDDLLVEGNQFRLDLGEQAVEISVGVDAKTLQVRGNRFYERPLSTDVSLLASGRWGIVAHNVAMHCVLTQGNLRRLDNVVQTRTEDECKRFEETYG